MTAHTNCKARRAGLRISIAIQKSCWDSGPISQCRGMGWTTSI